MKNSLSFLFSHKKKFFFLISTFLVFGGLVFSFFLASHDELNILPLILETRDHPKPLRTPDTFAEEYGPNASKAEIIYNSDTSFTFKYTKSKNQRHAFAGVFFPTENLAIDFSKYDAVEIGIETQRARRIPFNLSVQNKLETHQYVRCLIEIEKGKTIYNYLLKDFFTPTSWYDRNHVAQLDIPRQDFSKIEALSFESCHLLETETEDQFTIYRLLLKKDIRWIYVSIWTTVLVLIFLLRVWLFGLFRKKEKVVHIPVTHIEQEESEDIINRLLTYLANNYTNPNLTLTDLNREFGVSNQEISGMIKEKTALTFPKYITFLRIEEAKRILLEGSFKSISDVAYSVGFNSPSNFNRVFKASEGVSPKIFSEENKS